MNKLFFIIGMRRSGTSILRTMIESHQEIGTVEFEPHPLWNAVDLAHFSRFQSLPHVKEELSRFREAEKDGRWHGAKFALNPGTKALEWKWLLATFEGAKIIFILRNRNDTWKSVYKQDVDSFRGIIRKEAYDILFDDLVSGFRAYVNHNPTHSCILNYENLITDTNNELTAAWKLLGIEPMIGMDRYIIKKKT